MPEQIALSELVLSIPFKRCQRALAQWLDARRAAPHGMAGARAALRSLSGGERSRLLRWLDWRLYAANRNQDPATAARIERLAAWLGQQGSTPASETVPVVQTAISIATHSLPRRA